MDDGVLKDDSHNMMAKLAQGAVIKSLEQLNEALDTKQLMMHEMIALIAAMNVQQQG